MKKLQTHLMISFFAVSTLIMCTLLVTFYFHTQKQVSTELQETHLEMADHMGTTIDNMTNMLLFALSDGPFQRQFKSVLNEDMDKDPYEALQFQNQVAEMFTNYSDTYQNLQVSYYVTLYGFNGFKYCSMDHFDFDIFISGDFYQRILEADGKVVWDTTSPDPYLPTSSKNVYAMGRAIKTGKNYTISGVLAVIITEDSLYRSYRSTTSQEKNNCFIVDNTGLVVSSREKEAINSQWDCPVDLTRVSDNTSLFQTTCFYNGQETLFSFRRLSSSNWWLVDMMPLDILPLSHKRFMSTAGISVLFCMIFSILLSLLLSRKLSRPIRHLNKGMEQIAKGNLDCTLEEYSITEFNLLIRGFNRMASNIRQLIDTVRQKEAAKNAAEIRFLQVQVNPHFIYNTLNSIRCMILMGENQEAADIMVKVITMMRNVLSTHKLFNTLDEELKNLENYLEIEKLVYYNELNWSFEIAPNIHTVPVPRLILQPLAENSIFHGIVPSNITGRIEIKAWQKDLVLHVLVCDNGMIPLEKRRELMQKLAEPFTDSDSGRPHIGLFNTHQRLQYIYGPEFGIELLPDDGKGTRFLLRIPITAKD